MAFSIRQLQRDDAAAFRDIRLAALRAHPEAFGADHDHEAAQQLNFFADRLRSSAIFGGFDAENALAGVVGFYTGPSPKTRHIGHIWGVYVDPQQRGTGLAGALMTHVAAQRPADCLQLRLSVESSNTPALRLYQRHGFRIWARDQGALRVDGRLYDEILMRRDFD